MFGFFKRSKVEKEVKLEWHDYKGFRIAASPKAEGSQYRVAGVIEKDGDPVQQHSFVRADLIPNLEEATTFSLKKAELMIDQLGDGVFDS